MYNEFIPLVSEEQLGAFLEGKLSEIEHDRIRELISHDEALQEILEVNEIVNDSLKIIETSAFQYTDEVIDSESFELPTIGVSEMFDADSFELFNADDKQDEELHIMDEGESYSFNMEENIDTLNPDNTF